MSRELETVTLAQGYNKYLNVSEDSIRQWEEGKEHPVGPSLKLLSLVERKGLAAIA